MEKCRIAGCFDDFVRIVGLMESCFGVDSRVISGDQRGHRG